MLFTVKISFPANIRDAGLAAEMGSAADRACLALEKAIAEPSTSSHRCDITNALNYLETVMRQMQERGR